MRITFIGLLLLLCAVIGWAQPDPNQPLVPDRGRNNDPAIRLNGMLPTLNAQPPTMVPSAHGLFMIRNGVLAVFDGTAIKPAKQIELFGAMPAEPGANATDTQRQDYVLERIRRLLPSTGIVQDNELLLLIGEQYFRIDVNTLEIKLNVTLDLKAKLAPVTMLAQRTAPTLQVAGKSLLLLRGSRIALIDIATGTITGEGMLPKEMITPVLPAGLLPNNPGNAEKPNAGGLFDNMTETIIVGTVRRVELEGGFWGVEARDGKKYVLEGAMLKEMAATPNLNGARVRLIGTINNRPGIAQYGNGHFAVIAFEILPAAK